MYDNKWFYIAIVAFIIYIYWTYTCYKQSISINNNLSVPPVPSVPDIITEKQIINQRLTEQQLLQQQDQIEHNKRVTDQIETYLDDQSVPNYSQDNMSLGTLELLPITYKE